MVLYILAFVQCEELEEFIASIESFLDNIQRHYQICDITGMECDVRKLEQYIEIFAALSTVLLTVREVPGLVTQIVAEFADSLWQCKYVIFKRRSDLSKGKEIHSFVYETERTRGRPRFVFTKDQICVLRDTGMTWSNTSKCHSIS